MLWIKAFHLIFMVAWFAGLFYLPRLFVYHSLTHDAISLERFKVMERRLYLGIMTPAAVLTIIFGLILMMMNWPVYKHAGWFHTKLLLVLLLLGYHHMCGRIIKRFNNNENTHGDKYYRIFNEIPLLFLIAIVILAVVRPF